MKSNATTLDKTIVEPETILLVSGMLCLTYISNNRYLNIKNMLTERTLLLK